MRSKFRHVALIGKYQSPEVAEAVLRLANYLRGLGLNVLIEQGTASSTGLTAGFSVASHEEIGTRADLAVVLGGDGTLLNSAERAHAQVRRADGRRRMHDVVASSVH